MPRSTTIAPSKLAPSRAIPDPATEPFVSVSRVGAILGVSRRKAYYAVESGDIPSVRIGGTLRVPSGELLARLGLTHTGVTA